MKEYLIKAVERVDFTNAPRAEIDCYKWEADYAPHACAQLVWVEDSGLALRMTCDEADPTAVYKSYGDPVYRDSCMEFFLSADGGEHYINFEMNSAGALLSEFGTKDFPRTPISSFVTPPVPHAEVSPESGSWSVELFIPTSLIEALFGQSIGPGSTLLGNFYKCGDDTPKPHFGMWNEIDSATPCFHLPEFFAPLKIEK